MMAETHADDGGDNTTDTTEVSVNFYEQGTDAIKNAVYAVYGLLDQQGVNPSCKEAVGAVVERLANAQEDSQGQSIKVAVHDSGAVFLSVRSETANHREGEVRAPNGHVRFGVRGGIKDAECGYSLADTADVSDKSPRMLGRRFAPN